MSALTRALAMAMALLIAVLTVATAVTLRDTAPPGADGVSALYADWEPGGVYLGAAPIYKTTPANTFTAFVDSHDGTVTVRLSAASGGSFYSVRLSPPKGRTLSVGTYEAAQLNPGVAPALRFDGGCSTSTGRFTIHQLEMPTSTTVTRLAASFEQHCSRQVRAVYGHILYNATNFELPALLMSPAELIFDGPAATGTVTLSNAGTTQQSISAKVTGVHAADFAIVSDTCSVLDPGESCAVEIRFTPTSANSRVDRNPPRLGARAAYLALTDQTLRGERTVVLTGKNVPRSGVTVTPARNPVPIGHKVNLNVQAGSFASGKRVEILANDEVVATATLGAHGLASVAFDLPPGSYWVIALVHGTPQGRLESTPLRIHVRP